MTEPVQLLTIAYQAVSVARALSQIQGNLAASGRASQLTRSLSDIHGTLKNLESTLNIQIYQPLKSGLCMLSDAEAEYQVRKKSGMELASQALASFNKAEGQISDPENRLIAVVGVACAYKLLNKKGAYSSAARRANGLHKSIANAARLASALASGVADKDPCPCGSGKRYENCHGLRK
jgi:hypothetical protein